jgi:hypothetical protein
VDTENNLSRERLVCVVVNNGLDEVLVTKGVRSCLGVGLDAQDCAVVVVCKQTKKDKRLER